MKQYHIYKNQYCDTEDFTPWYPEDYSTTSDDLSASIINQENVSKKIAKVKDTTHLEIYKKNGAICFPSYFNESLDEFTNVITKFKKIWFFKCFNQSIDILPNDIEELRLGSDFSQTVNKYPVELKNLVLYCNIPIDNLPNIEVLRLYGKFNSPIDNLPNSIKEIYIGGIFNQPIDNLPDSLIKLEIGTNYDEECLFDKEINNLPNSIKHLVIKTKYNHKITLPDNLEYLEIYNNNILPPILPSNLKVLKLLGEFNQSIENLLPIGLEELEFGPFFNQPIENEHKSFIPSTVKKLSNCDQNYLLTGYSHNISKLPDSIKEINLTVKNYFYSINKLPSDLRKFRLCDVSYCNSHDKILKIESFPSQILEINISTQNKIILPDIPDSCEILELKLNDNPAPEKLPTNLKVFNLNCHPHYCYSMFRPNQKPYPVFKFPKTLTHLSIDELDLRKTTLPEGLISLRITFNCWLVNLPDTIEELIVEHVQHIDKLPSNIKNIYSHYSNSSLIKPLLNSNIEYKEHGLLERSHGIRTLYISV